MRNEDSIAREIAPGVGPGHKDRSLVADVAYDVQRVLYRKWIIAAVEFLLKVALIAFCGWLMWRGAAGLFTGADGDAINCVSPWAGANGDAINCVPPGAGANGDAINCVPPRAGADGDAINCVPPRAGAGGAANLTAGSSGRPIPGTPAVLAFLLAILLLPVVTISFIRVMVAKRSNGANALTLGIYTAVDFILAYFMVGASLETPGRAVLFIGAGVFSLLYNFTVMNYALRLEDGR